MEADIEYLRIYHNGEKDREAEDYQAQPTIAAAYKGLLQTHQADRNQCPNLGKLERHGLFHSTDKHYSERTEKEVQAAYW